LSELLYVVACFIAGSWSHSRGRRFATKCQCSVYSRCSQPCIYV